MNKFLVLDNYSGNEEIVLDTIEQVFDYFRDEEIENRTYDIPTVYEIVKEIKIQAKPAEFSVISDEPTPDIPAPRPGESVTDYARRITGG